MVEKNRVLIKGGRSISDSEYFYMCRSELSKPPKTDMDIITRSVTYPTEKTGVVYFLVSPYDPEIGIDVIYVGQTINLPSRLETHRRNIPFDSFAWFSCPIDQLNNYEAHYILTFNPPYNRSVPSNDRYKTLKGCRSDIWREYRLDRRKVDKRFIETTLHIKPVGCMGDNDYYDVYAILNALAERFPRYA